MASQNQCLASLARISLFTGTRPSSVQIAHFLAPSALTFQVRYAAGAGNKPNKNKKEKKKKVYKIYKVHDKTGLEQYSLCDAIRYLRAFEVGQPPHSIKYELHVKLRTNKNGPVLRKRIRLPHPVKTSERIAVICPDDSLLVQEARYLGAVAAGQESLFQQIRDGNINFQKLICHTSSEAALRAANLGRILGPKGLMPNMKMKTITNNVPALMKNMVGETEYRERVGVVHMAIAQIGFTPRMVADNLKAFMGEITAGVDRLSDTNFVKSIDEVVLSTTHGPGFSLSGDYAPTDAEITEKDLSSPM